MDNASRRTPAFRAHVLILQEKYRRYNVDTNFTGVFGFYFEQFRQKNAIRNNFYGLSEISRKFVGLIETNQNFIGLNIFS